MDTSAQDCLQVLVVDDYESMRRVLVNALKKLGHAVDEAENGLAALEKLRSEKYDLIFTDIVMPEMDGFELCQELSKNPEFINIPVVVVSTHCDSSYVIRALRLGADDYIPKPIEKDLLKTVITRLTTQTPVES